MCVCVCETLGATSNSVDILLSAGGWSDIALGRQNYVPASSRTVAQAVTPLFSKELMHSAVTHSSFEPIESSELWDFGLLTTSDGHLDFEVVRSHRMSPILPRQFSLRLLQGLGRSIQRAISRVCVCVHPWTKGLPPPLFPCFSPTLDNHFP